MFEHFTFKGKKKATKQISEIELHFYASLARQTLVLPESGVAILKTVNLLFSQYADSLLSQIPIVMNNFSIFNKAGIPVPRQGVQTVGSQLLTGH